MLLLIASLAVLLVLGVPVAYSLGLSAMSYFLVYHPELISILPQRVFSGMDSEAMIALPLFILMGLLMNAGGITTRLIDFSMIFVGKLRGGLGLVNVFASMVFGGISGSSVSDTASIGAVLIPEMKRKGYTGEFASGITVASSTMGMIIPPSVPMVIYSLVSSESVGKLFLASFIPGILIGLIMLAITLGVSLYKKYPKEEITLTRTEKWSTIRKSLMALIMPFFVIGSVVFGIVTATESAAIGVLYAFLMGIFVTKDLKLRAIPKLMKSSIITSANVMIIIAICNLYIWILALERVPLAVAGFIGGLNLPVSIVLLMIIAVILATGTFVDVSPAILLLTPVFLPALIQLGVSPLQFGVLLVSGLAVGLVTPPVGMCLNVASAISGLGIVKIFKAAAPYLLANIITLILIAYVKPITLWLPSLIK